jgi:hypothetical protein
MKFFLYTLLLSSACAFNLRPLYSDTSVKVRPCIRKTFPSTVGMSPMQQQQHVGKAKSFPNKSFLTPLKSAAEDSIPDDKMAKKIKGRKKRVSAGYTITTVGYTLFALIFARSLSPLALYIASGMTTAAGVAYILKGAAENNRLSSDTYKRLNLALGTYGLIGIIARNTLDFSVATKLWTFISFVTMVNCTKGFGYGFKGWELSKVNPVTEIVDGAKSTITTLAKVPSNLKSAGYLISTLGFTYLSLSKLMEIISSIQLSTGMFPLFAFRLNKLMLLSAVTFTLKDAADRDRLEGTTFIELNFLVAFASATMAAYSFTNQSDMLGGAFASFTSLLCTLSGILSVLKKKSS